MSEQNHKNRYCRKAIFKNFRNLGYDAPAEIVLNRTLDKYRLGGLTVLIGPNNAGKSNVIDAIISSKFNNYSGNDVPEFITDEEKIPECKIVAVDDKTEYTTDMDIEQAVVDSVIYGQLTDEQYDNFESVFIRMVRSYCPNMIDLEKDYSETSLYATTEMIRILSRNLGYRSNRSLDTYEGVILTITDKLNEIANNSIERERFIEQYTDEDDEFFEKYGFSLYPRIVKYKEEPIKQSDLKSPYKPFNRLMVKVLTVCNGLKKVADAYEKYQKTGNTAFLTKVENYLNVQIGSISDRFNRLYYANDAQYFFNFHLFENTINLEIFLGDQPLNLDNQSTGFRWFLNFFFNLMCNDELGIGDIVLMDEPATNLHVAGQIELRNFIREYGKNAGIMFIVSTHSPFFVDCDYLDDLRIVQRKENGTAVIFDKFSTISPEDPDQMDPVLRNLTVGRHIVLEPSKKTIFVEGITDYNYLTAAKIMLNCNDITFMPINGIKKEHLTNEDVIKRLRLIDDDPILLVDGDEAGNAMKESAKGKGIEVISLKDIDGRFRTIESLFKKEDLEKFDLSNKDWHSSSIYKQFIYENLSELSDYAKENFRKVLDRLSD